MDLAVTDLTRKVIGTERDACAIYAIVAKQSSLVQGEPLWDRAVQALQQMEHRAGQSHHRTDGTGIMGELPHRLWQRRLEEAGIDVRTTDGRFWVVSLAMRVVESRQNTEKLGNLLEAHQFRPLVAHWDAVDGDEGLWAMAALYEGKEHLKRIRAQELMDAIERVFPAQLASLSDSVGVLKLRNGARALREVLRGQWGEDYSGRAVIGHNRFSTNTATDLRRVQPFLGLAHNGEINTIDRLMRDMDSLGLTAVQEGSDSQNLDRLIMGLCQRYGLEPAEAIRLVIAPSPAVLEKLPQAVQEGWRHAQSFWAPVAQGPAAIVYLSRGSVVAAVDALGLRPLWFLETHDAYILSSESGVVPSSRWVKEPFPIAPGEVVAIRWHGMGRAHVVHSGAIERALINKFSNRPSIPHFASQTEMTPNAPLPEWRLAADGWKSDDVQTIRSWQNDAHEPIGSLGFDGPLGSLSTGIVNVADYLHETVAVVTNPALDREREREHFRLDVMLGGRAAFNMASEKSLIRLSHPWLNDDDLTELHHRFSGRWQTISMNWPLGMSEREASERVAQKVSTAARRGSAIVILDDADSYVRERSISLDPLVALTEVQKTLAEQQLQRQVSIIVRSSAIRHLHDAALLLGMGASALVPYAIWGLVQSNQYSSVVEVMNQGLEKIISTMGTHELVGYGRAFSAIGLSGAMAELMGIISYAPVEDDVWEDRRLRMQSLRHGLLAEEKTRLRYITRSTTHVYKAAIKLAEGSMESGTFHQALLDLQSKQPVQLRHVLRVSEHGISAVKARVSTRGYALPFVISSMSFGSQGETAFRAYAEAARDLKMVSMNGEGGEIPDMIGKYYPWRGYQIASGRFGINAALINGAQYIEIKIGQGAKPGEGGHLPGRKVSLKVAEARRAQYGIDLISPSNNHDLYSIEDLRQLIDELRAVHPDVRVVVKVPIVPNIGTIAVGIVKAGADVVTLSGSDGGTGAARMHALRHVGLPADIGVPIVHAALSQAHLRDGVEIWADGGMRSGDDALKMILLGADRVGFATLAMVALGCTICRQCQKDTCHVGITTQIASLEEAQERGIKHFHPQDLDQAVARLTRLFGSLGDYLAQRLGALGIFAVEEAVGRWDLLEAQGERARPFMQFLDQLHHTIPENRSLIAVGEVTSSVEARVPISGDMHISRLRTLGTELSGSRVRSKAKELAHETVEWAHPVGQGFGAFLHHGVRMLVKGGAQDGTAKSASGGYLAIMKAQNHSGQYFGGHVGKSMAYGAQGGVFVVQGGADARAGIRMAGANLVIMGDGLASPKEAKTLWESAAIKGFAFEYMTRGTAIVLADPGPWMASGMTGGTIYLLRNDKVGLTREFLLSRIAHTAQVQLALLDSSDLGPVKRLLDVTVGALSDSGQSDRAAQYLPYRDDPLHWFFKVVAVGEQADPAISTE